MIIKRHHSVKIFNLETDRIQQTNNQANYNDKQGQTLLGVFISNDQLQTADTKHKKAAFLGTVRQISEWEKMI